MTIGQYRPPRWHGRPYFQAFSPAKWPHPRRDAHGQKYLNLQLHTLILHYISQAMLRPLRVVLYRECEGHEGWSALARYADRRPR